MLDIGVRVRIDGMKSSQALKYNGTEGKVTGYKESTERWDVVMDLDGSLKSLKESVLTVLAPMMQ